MSKGKKFFKNKVKKRLRTPHKKANKGAITKDVVNKKAIFNRYKDRQKVEEELKKKKHLEEKLQLQLQQARNEESEEEEDTYSQLLSCFKEKGKTKAIAQRSLSEESMSTEESDSEQNVTINKNKEVEPGEEDDIDNSEDSCSTMEDMVEDNAATDNNIDTYDDPFTKHFHFDLSNELVVSLSNSPKSEKTVNKTWPVLGKMSITIPQPVETLSKKEKPKISIIEDVVFAPLGVVPQYLSNVDFKQLHLKSQIHANIVSSNKCNLIRRDLELSEIITPLQKELFAIINNYQDLYFPERTFTTADEIRYIYCLHVVNHVLKTRVKILHHNAKLAKNSDVGDEYRDQGLVRPKVLVLVPFKDAAYRVVKTLIDIVLPKEAGQIVNKKRFDEDFTGGELIMPKKNPKPEDYELLFRGNTEDTFRLGISLTKKTLKLYTDFYASDILIASPLGLRMIVGAEGEEERDYDFLASIELLVMDQSDVFLMQNWDHLLHILDHMHLQPKKTHGTDFSRVRSWAVNGWSKYYRCLKIAVPHMASYGLTLLKVRGDLSPAVGQYGLRRRYAWACKYSMSAVSRQTLVFSSVALPEIKAIFNRKCHNYAGKVEVANPTEVGTIQHVLLQVPQLFHRFNATSPLASVDARFEYFVKEVLPKQRDALMSHTLIYVPSYFDYVRLRNYFKKEDISFVQICEYSKEAKIARARDMFFHTEAHFMLYSERVHFFRRFRIKGIRHIIFYQLPTYPHFYSEMCNLMQESNQNKLGGSACNSSVAALVCRYDAARAAAVLGAPRLARLAAADKPLHMYVTEAK